VKRPGTFDVVDQFERAVAEFTGAPYCVAVSTGTAAIFLSLMFRRMWWYTASETVLTCPARTYISVPMMVIHAGFKLSLIDKSWVGSYHLDPVGIWDSTLRFRRGMYAGGLECLSFHARKHLNIGEGGAILCSEQSTADWLRRARNCGKGEPDFDPLAVTMLGWSLYMTPEKAARGLHILAYLPGDLPDQDPGYPDLRNAPVFKGMS